MFWAAIEFQTGLMRKEYYKNLKNIRDYDSIFRKYPSGASVAFIVASRWSQVYGDGNVSWLEQFRATEAEAYHRLLLGDLPQLIEVSDCQLLSAKVVNFLNIVNLEVIKGKPGDNIDVLRDIHDALELTIDMDPFGLKVLDLYSRHRFEPDYQALFRVLLSELFASHADLYHKLDKIIQKAQLNQVFSDKDAKNQQ